MKGSKIERAQCNASLAITGDIRGASQAIPGIRFGITQDQIEDI